MNPRSDIHQQVLSATDTPSLMALYSGWAQRYDHDLKEAWGYPAPAAAVEQLTRYVGQKNSRILDAGCGTGLVGQLLHEQAYVRIEGLDFSAEMLDQARRKEVYQTLIQADMNQRLPLNDNEFDAVTCVGTFTATHVHPHALDELLRVTRPGGHVVFTVRDTYWDETQFDRAIVALAHAGLARIHEWHTQTYIREEGSECKLIVLEALNA